MGISSLGEFEDQKFQNISAWLEDEINRVEGTEQRRASFEVLNDGVEC
jgi:hypothetical protein